MPYFANATKKDIESIMGLGNPRDICQQEPESPFTSRAFGSETVFDDVAMDDNPADTDDDIASAAPDGIPIFDEVAPVEESGTESDSAGIFDHVPQVEFSGSEFDSELDDADIDVSHTLDTPPFLHIIDNATNGLADVMQNFSEVVEGAKETCKMLRGRDSKPKFIELCLHGPGAWAIPHVKKFKGD